MLHIHVNGYRFPGEFGQMGGFLYRLEQWEEARDTHRNREESVADIVLNHMSEMNNNGRKSDEQSRKHAMTCVWKLKTIRVTDPAMGIQ